MSAATDARREPSGLKATPAQIALAWLLSREVCMIPGTRKIERLQENWAAQDVSLNSEIRDRLDAIIQLGVSGERY